MRCLHCSRQFSGARKTAKFCCTACRVAYSRIHKRNNSVTLNNSAKERVILSLCDLTGNWLAPYSRAGYRVIQLDLALGQDIRLLEYPGRVHGILAAPPCTCFSLAGNRWQRSRQEMIDALSVVDACLRLVAVCRPTWWALENPRGRLSRYLGPAKWEFQPSDYGSPWTKRTCLWGNFVVPKPRPVTPEYSLCAVIKDARRRSETPISFAEAFFEANP